MAERRMFARTIVTSDTFLDMPMSARCLYFTLGMFADDDGFVNNPKGIMRQIGASIDDMKLLIAKSYLIDFESGVIVIKHWRINNYLRSDRHQDTKYTEEKQMLEIKPNGAYTLKDENGTGIPVGIPTVGKRYTQDSIGKDSIGKNSIDNTLPEKTATAVVRAYNEICHSLPKVTKLTDMRIKHINARLKEHTEEELRQAFLMAEASDFLTGRTDRSKWKADFNWLMNENNLIKVLEGNYTNEEKTDEIGEIQKRILGADSVDDLDEETKKLWEEL